jgi:hypothetical protein
VDGNSERHGTVYGQTPLHLHPERRSSTAP